MDTVRSTLGSYTLGANVENLNLLAATPSTAPATPLPTSSTAMAPTTSCSAVAENDTINGGDGRRLIDGGTGNDTLSGGTGNVRHHHRWCWQRHDRPAGGG